MMRPATCAVWRGSNCGESFLKSPSGSGNGVRGEIGSVVKLDALAAAIHRVLSLGSTLLRREPGPARRRLGVVSFQLMSAS
jgi:hypothetical protein